MFEIRTQSIEHTGSKVCLSVQIRNTGSLPGKEVAQIYCSAAEDEITRPYQELVCYAKTGLLKPNETQLLTLEFDLRDIAVYDERRSSRILPAGEYVLRAGNCSRDTEPVAVLVLDKTVQTEKLRNLFQDSDPADELNLNAERHINAGLSVPRINIDTSEIRTVSAVYTDKHPLNVNKHDRQFTADDVMNGRCSIEDLVSQLSIEEMAELCVGTMRSGGVSVVGNASESVPGAAGDTSAVLEGSRGIRGIIMADGPAGLRLQPSFKSADGSETYYQYCTALPIGWSLAQSWNNDLIEEAGRMIGSEMKLFGIDLWLAPALNIHRDPLCGRNFEYYSEEPLISGKTAAAMIRGVQSNKGCGATIKHLAANSQEDNRYFTNSHVSERALREIYLKGFEIAIRESQPAAIMTSYNLINGIHAANNRDLLQYAVRDEWGFNGMIMTDWFTSQSVPGLTDTVSKYPISSSAGCIYAGNDIQMPGCTKNVDDIVEAVKTGRALDGYHITIADLQFCAANVIRTALYCQ